MRTQNKYLLIIPMLMALSCTEKIDPTPFEYSQIFSGKTSKTWSLTSLTFRNDGEDYWVLEEACWSDDKYIFYRDVERKFEFITGNKKCSADEQPFTLTDTWSFTNGTATFTFIFPLLNDSPLPFTVTKVDKKNMVLDLFTVEDGSESYQLKLQATDEK
jgi:hypothetical protein